MKKRSSKEAVHVSETTAVVAPIDHWGVWGRRTRHGLLKLIDLGQPLLVALQDSFVRFFFKSSSTHGKKLDKRNVVARL